MIKSIFVKLYLGMYWGVCILILFGLRILSPWIHVMVAYQYTGRIGHTALDFDVFLCEKLKYPERFKNKYILFFAQDIISNVFLFNLWKEKSNGWKVVCNKLYLALWLEKVNKKYHIHEPLVLQLKRTDEEAVTIGMPPLLKIASEIKGKCLKKLKEKGISGKFITVHNRDSVYETRADFQNQGDFNFHDYRNSIVDNYKASIQMLLQSGYSVIRVGRDAKSQLPIQPGFLDYPFQPDIQSDEMDIFLLSECEFFISTTTGITHVASVFRIPQLVVNAIPFDPILLRALTPQSIVVPKLLWNSNEKRFLTFAEMGKLKISIHSNECPYRSLGLEPIENTSEEIAMATREMCDQLSGSVSFDSDQDDLQSRFWNQMPETEEWNIVKNKFKHRICSGFLHIHRELL